MNGSHGTFNNKLILLLKTNESAPLSVENVFVVKN